MPLGVKWLEYGKTNSVNKGTIREHPLFFLDRLKAKQDIKRKFYQKRNQNDTIPWQQWTKKIPGRRLGCLELFLVQMLREDSLSKQKFPRLLTIGKQGKYSNSWNEPEWTDWESAKGAPWNGAFAFSSRSFISKLKALGSISPSTVLITSNSNGHVCWRSSRSSGNCLIGSSFFNFSNNDSTESNCRSKAQTGDDFPNAVKSAQIEGGNETSVP